MTAAGDPNVGGATSGSRRIVLCADDYGISPAVNVAIRDLIVRGRLSATSVMVTAPTFDRFEAAALDVLNTSRRRVAIGLHFTLTAPYRPSARVLRRCAAVRSCRCPPCWRRACSDVSIRRRSQPR